MCLQEHQPLRQYGYSCLFLHPQTEAIRLHSDFLFWMSSEHFFTHKPHVMYLLNSLRKRYEKETAM